VQSISSTSGTREQVNCLFLDLNSYFASVEQQLQPGLRGKPVIVVPLMAETTCAIAASYEAKAHGIRTGTGVKEAKQMCPGLQIVEARHEIYVNFHHKIMEAVESCLPIAKIVSIDEAACALTGSQRQVEKALGLARQVKARIKQQAGEYLRCSVGLAPNTFLAKIASDMQKPDGLVVIRRSDLPHILYTLKPSDLPGIGHRMSRRLERNGIDTVENLCSLSAEQMRKLWGGVVGSRFWYRLRGEQIDDIVGPQSSVGHQHVLPPTLRNMEAARAVCQKLLCKAAVRIRRMNLWARGMSVYVSFSMGREKNIWEAHTRILESQDTLALLQTFCKMWQDCPQGKPSFVGVTLYDLIPAFLHTAGLFAEESRGEKLSQTMDRLNLKYGVNTLYVAGVHKVRDAAPPRIAFNSIPEFDV
jgi:DNA polymerase-4